jgi:hypothetical protein
MTSLIEHIAEVVAPHVEPDLTMRDISSWNGVPDIPSLGAQIIAIKATEGTGYISPVFQRDWINTKVAGKARMAYHFLHPSISGLAQARFFLDTVNNAGLLDGDCLAVDFEETDGLDAEAAGDTAVAFRAAVEKEANCKLVIYTNLSMAESGACANLGNNPLWIANPSRPAGNPQIPHPWTKWYFHQWGERKGIDEDICNFKSLEAFYKLAILPKPPPLAPNQRMVRLTDGKMSTTSLVLLDKLVTGFKLQSGDAVFEITEDGAPKSAI